MSVTALRTYPIKLVARSSIGRRPICPGIRGRFHRNTQHFDQHPKLLQAYRIWTELSAGDSEPSSRTAAVREQPNPWDVLPPQPNCPTETIPRPDSRDDCSV